MVVEVVSAVIAGCCYCCCIGWLHVLEGIVIGLIVYYYRIVIIDGITYCITVYTYSILIVLYILLYMLLLLFMYYIIIDIISNSVIADTIIRIYSIISISIYGFISIINTN